MGLPIKLPSTENFHLKVSWVDEVEIVGNITDGHLRMTAR